MTPDQAVARLDTAGLTGEETTWLLAYLCGWTPDGVSGGVAAILEARRLDVRSPTSTRPDAAVSEIPGPVTRGT